MRVNGEGKGNRSLADLWPHALGVILSHGVWALSWDRVPNPQKPLQLPAVTPRLKERAVQKPRCFWCSQYPGEDRDGAATSPTQPHTPARREMRGGGALFLLHRQLTAAINQPGRALPLIVALQCFAGLKQQEQRPG